MTTVLRRTLALWKGKSDDGLTITEVAIATGVFGVVIILVSAMLATGMRGVLLGKRREVATQEASKAVELARSLSYNEVGLAVDDPTIDSDPAIVDDGGVKKVLVDPEAGIWEPLVWATTPTAHVFNPHHVTIERGSSTLDRYVYVTSVDTDGDGNGDMRRIFTRVTWNNAGTQGSSNEVRTQTFVDENAIFTVCPDEGDEACKQDGRTPMSSETSASAGSLSVRSDRGDLVNLIDAVLPPDPVVGQLPSSSGSTELRAVSTTTCNSIPTTLQLLDTTYGGEPVGVTADDDAATSTPSNPPDDTWSGIDSIGGGGEIDRLLTEASIGGSVSCHASAADADGLAPTDDGLPYEKGTGTNSGSMTFTEDISGADLGTDTLIALSAANATTNQSIDHVPGASREITSIAGGSVGELEVMEIAGVFPQGLASVDAFSYEVQTTASAGTASQAPSISVPGGIDLRIYDPNGRIPSGTCDAYSGGYCEVNLDVAGGEGLGVSFTDSITQNLGLTTLSWEIDVQAFPPKTDPISGVAGPSGERRWQAAYAGVQITARLQIEVDVSGVGVLLTDTETIASAANVNANGCAGVGCA